MRIEESVDDLQHGGVDDEANDEQNNVDCIECETNPDVVVPVSQVRHGAEHKSRKKRYIIQ